ncbi:MAG: heme exporter protein CcmD [Devosia sp.]|nr:heme exporter protein CcmD [Devosia sp.]
MDLGPHAVFIVWAYGGVFAGVLGLIGFAIFDARRTNRRLKDLEARGIRRRSAGTTP